VAPDGSDRVVSAGARTFESGITVEVQLDAVEALSFAQSMRTLIRARKIPRGTAEIYERIAKKMLEAANVAIAAAAKQAGQ
jgi:O6-methylguanine-DNA--protein-cysteine methyltransferase